MGPLKDTDFLKKARARFRLANDADADQAERERDDIAFEAGDQWPADLLNARKAQQPVNGLPAVPARPTLVINKVKEPVRQILNQERQSDIGIEIVPADDFGDLGITPDDTEITLREGLVRRIQRESQAADARTWAFKRAVIAGRGYYLVMPRFLPGKTWDQEVCVERIYNQNSVKGDPSRTLPDGSDSEFWFWGTWMLSDRFVSEYPKVLDGEKAVDNPFAQYADNDFMGLTEDYPDWYKSGGSTDGDHKLWSVRVENYAYVERTSRTLAVMGDGSVAWEDEMPDGAEAVDTRTVVEKTIKLCKIAGGILKIEEDVLAGPDMPIVQVLGDEILPYDDQRRVEGIVRPARDPGKGENYLISKFVESVGLSQIPRDRLDPDAIDGYEAWWAVANTRTLPYLPYRTRDDNNQEFRQPTPANGDPNILPMAQGIAMFDGFIQQTTGGSAPDRLGVGQRVQAASAIQRLQDEEQFNTSNFLDNLARSLRYEGQIENNLLYPIYGAKPGRLVRILTGTGDAEQMVIGGDTEQPQQQQRAKAAKVAKLTKDANFNVIVKVAKNSERRRDQFVAQYGEILHADPSQMMVGGDLFYKNMDIPEAKQLAKRMRVMLAPPIQALLAAEEKGQPFDPVAQGKITQLQQQLQHAEQAMQELDQIANGKRMETEAKVQIEREKNQASVEQARIEAYRDVRLQQMKNAAVIDVAKLNLLGKGVIADQQAMDEAIALGHTQAHEAAMQAQDHAQQQTLAAAGMEQAGGLQAGQQAHEAQMGEQGHAQALEQGDQAQAHALESQQQAADLAPEPTAEGA